MTRKKKLNNYCIYIIIYSIKVIGKEKNLIFAKIKFCCQ